MASFSCGHQNHQRPPPGLVILCVASLLVWRAPAVQAQQPANPFQLQWSTTGVNNLSSPTSAVGGNFIGPLSPGTPLTVTVTTSNTQPTPDYVSRVKLSWTGAYSDYQPNPTILYGLACLPFQGAPSPAGGPSYFLWDFAAADFAPFTPSGLAIAFFFQMSGVIGNVVDQSYLLLTVELTTSTYAVTQKTYAIQIGPPSTTPAPTTATMNATARPVVMGANATMNATNQTNATPTPSPTTSVKVNQTASPTTTKTNATVPTPTPSATTNTNIRVPTPSPTAATKVNPPSPTATTKVNPPTPTPTTKANPVTPTPTPTAGTKTNAGVTSTCPYQPAASTGNTCFSADGKTTWHCAEPAPQCAQNGVNECLPTQGYPFHNAATGQVC